MNDVERGLRDLAEKAENDVARELRPRPEALRRIRRRRAAFSTTALVCVATVVAAGAFAWTGGREDRPLPPAATPPPVDAGSCLVIPFEPTYVPEGFSRDPKLAGEKGRPGLLGTFQSTRPAAIEVTTPRYALSQTRPRPLEVLGARATIGLIHEGYSVELRYGECGRYVLNGYGVTRSELRRFATGLVPVLGPPPTEPAVLVWPEDTADEAEAACAEAAPRERTGPQVVSGFAMDVLGWESPVYEAPRRRSGPWTVFPSERNTYGGEVEAGVRVWTTEIVPGCRSIRSVSRLADHRPTGVGISVDGEIVEVTYAPLGATAATVEVGYGGRTRRVYDRIVQGRVRVWLRFTPRTTGHFLVLLRDEDDDVFTAYGGPLPAGDFTGG